MDVLNYFRPVYNIVKYDLDASNYFRPISTIVKHTLDALKYFRPIIILLSIRCMLVITLGLYLLLLYILEMTFIMLTLW